MPQKPTFVDGDGDFLEWVCAGFSASSMVAAFAFAWPILGMMDVSTKRYAATSSCLHHR
jgi:hypothetical protein